MIQTHGFHNACAYKKTKRSISEQIRCIMKSNTTQHLKQHVNKRLAFTVLQVITPIVKALLLLHEMTRNTWELSTSKTS